VGVGAGAVEGSLQVDLPNAALESIALISASQPPGQELEGTPQGHPTFPISVPLQPWWS
jgi:hypothetical protein